MFGLFKSKEQKAVEAFWASPPGQRLVTHNEQYFGESAVWGKYSAEGRAQLTEWLLERIIGVCNAPNPFAQMRLEIAAMASCYAELTVLLKYPLPPEMQTRFVSGELHQHLRKCSEHCKELAEEVWRNPQGSDAELHEYANQRSIYYNFVLNGLNQLRYEFDDFAGGAEKDWLRPFVKSMLIWHEDIFRSKIGLPRLSEDKVLNALPHSTFFNLVHHGERNPLFVWESTNGEHAKAC